MSDENTSLSRVIRKELALLAGFLFIGLVLLPVAVYFVGQAIFGDYGGQSYGQFFGDLASRIRAGEGAAWFLVLSPYLGWQILRLIAFGWRSAGHQSGAG
jgi:hypothetical protein